MMVSRAQGQIPVRRPAARSLLIKPVSGDCNLHCTYCFYHDRQTDPYKEEQRHRMGPGVLAALIQQGMALDRRQGVFGWQGGEPTLAGLGFFEKVVELQQRYGTAGQVVSNGMQTNGLLLTVDWAHFLHKYNFLVGVSIDGPADYHDHYRRFSSGSPTHERVLDVLRLLTRHEVEFNILTVVNRVTAEHGSEIYDYFASMGYAYLQFIPCVEVDPQTGKLTDFSVSPEQFGDFMCAVFDKWYNDGHPVVSVRDFDAILAVYVGQEAQLCCYHERCGSYLVVEYNGDVYPCDFLVEDKHLVGNILTTPLTQLFEAESVRRFADNKASPRPECQACAWLPYCNQGCPRFLGKEGSRRNYLCRAYQRFFAHSHSGFLELGQRALRDMGVDLARAPRPPTRAIGRNDPCPCGSGLKFKRCCGAKERA